MSTATQIKNMICAAAATVAGLVAQALGGWDQALQILVGFMAVDYLSGFLTAAVFHHSTKTESGRASSRAGFQGLLRKCAILMLVFLAVMLDKAAGGDFARGAVCFFFIANEGLSILENLALMGVPCPRFLKGMLEVLREKGDQGGKEK